MADVRIVLEGQPIGKGRPRFSLRGGFARAYTPAKTRSYELALANAANKAMGSLPMLHDAVDVWVEAVFAIPSSWSKKKRQAALDGDLKHISRPDVDNIGKCAFDALNGIVWKDDSQIASTQINKRYGHRPRLLIEVTRLEINNEHLPAVPRPSDKTNDPFS